MTYRFLITIECTIYVFGRGSTLDSTGGAYSVPPNPLVGLRWTTVPRDGIGKGKER